MGTDGGYVWCGVGGEVKKEIERNTRGRAALQHAGCRMDGRVVHKRSAQRAVCLPDPRDLF